MAYPSRSFLRFTGVILGAALAYLPVSSLAQVQVSRISNSDISAVNKGLVYSLPRTVLSIRLEMTRTDEVPGPYASFATELLGIQNMITDRKTTYTLDKAILIPYTEADPDQLFLVEKDEKASEDIFLAFSRCGLILGADQVSEEDHTTPSIQGISPMEIAMDDIFPVLQTGAMKEIVDTIVRIVAFDTLTYQQKILKRLMVSQSDREKALDAVYMINSIGQDQYNLLVGYQETSYSAEVMIFMIDRLEEQRRNYLQLFNGVVRKEKFVFTVNYLPTIDVLQSPIAIAGFSTMTGLKEADGDNDITISLARKGITSSLSSEPGQAEGFSGYFYRIPESCEIIVSHHGKVVGNDVLPVNQFGVVLSLPPSATQVEFYPETGGIKKVILK